MLINEGRQLRSVRIKRLIHALDVEIFGGRAGRSIVDILERTNLRQNAHECGEEPRSPIRLLILITRLFLGRCRLRPAAWQQRSLRCERSATAC